MGENMLATNICSQEVSNHWFCVKMIHSIMIVTCYPPGEVVGGLYGRLLVVDAEVHHVDVTIAGAGGWWGQQTLQIRGECAVCER